MCGNIGNSAVDTQALLEQVGQLHSVVKRLEMKTELLSQKNSIQSKIMQQLIESRMSSKSRQYFCDQWHPNCKIWHSRFNIVNSNLKQVSPLKKTIIPYSKPMSCQADIQLIKMVTRKIDILEKTKYGVPQISSCDTVDLIHHEFRSIWEHVQYFQHNFQCKVFELASKSSPPGRALFNVPKKSKAATSKSRSCIIMESRPMKFNSHSKKTKT